VPEGLRQQQGDESESGPAAEEAGEEEVMGTSHTITGVTAGSLVAVPLVLLGLDPVPALVFVVVWALASVLPDIDHKHGAPTRWLGWLTRLIGWVVRLFVDHREATHTKTGAVVFGLLVAAATFPISWDFWLWGLATTGGCLTHRGGDMRTLSGLKVNGRKKRIGRPFRAGSKHEKRLRTWIYQPIAVISLLVLILTIGGLHA
jgi:membrane-bound metal-dependent hydrolase YbcI (DUF457 family)